MAVLFSHAPLLSSDPLAFGIGGGLVGSGLTGGSRKISGAKESRGRRPEARCAPEARPQGMPHFTHLGHVVDRIVLSQQATKDQCEMNKKGKKSGGGVALGRSLIKDRNKTNKRVLNKHGWLHSCELEDGYDWGRLNLQSVTEQSTLEDFLSTAELAGVEFKAEKMNIKVVDSTTYTGLPTEKEKAAAREAEQENVQYLSIPRRPSWDSSTSAQQLEERERESFLEWRRSLIRLQEDDRLTLTPFERNLDFWRQLWRVVEKSDILVQIVDARNPLLFRCEDLEKYVLEIDPKKVNMVLISKADLLSPQQRLAWKEYFHSNAMIVVAFWSALLEEEKEEEEGSVEAVEGEGSVCESEEEENPVVSTETTPTAKNEAKEATPTAESDAEATHTDDGEAETIPKDDGEAEAAPTDDSDAETTPIEDSEVEATPKDYSDDETTPTEDSEANETTPVETTEATPTLVEEVEDEGSKILCREELIALFHEISPVPRGSLTTVGMVGYPNVGKSSTINALFEGKKVPVSATPGRTKHFQTLFLSEDLMLCDCPGLVFPSFLSSKAEMVCSGILPIDQLRDHIAPVSLVCERIPRPVLEGMYGITLPLPGEGEDPQRPPGAHELLSAYGCRRGYMTSHGQPDEPRSARYILKNYVKGKLSFCHPPPGSAAGQFNQWPSQESYPNAENAASQEESPEAECSGQVEGQGSEAEGVKPRATAPPPRMGHFDVGYFQQENVRVLTKGRGIFMATVQEGAGDPDKPWKKHNNKHKKEKTRRTVPN